MRGLSINGSGAGVVELEFGVRQPLLYLSGNIPVFEVWYWDDASRLWFAATTDPAAVTPQGAVGFHPMQPLATTVQLRDQWRAYRQAGGREPGCLTRV